ncbi:unnamed protein product [Meganyctiphanes norvegica]|uniref:Uncharacterized protein n=1 Tax=Meganyctiphanes norvegica TaxID=48144 RepID=A0AAV2RB81_MEGNR
MAASSPTSNAESDCVSYAATYMKVGASIQYQAVPSPPQALPVAVYQVAPSATYQILDQDYYPLLCLNISCFPHGDYQTRRCSWEVAVGDYECLHHSSEGSTPLLSSGEDSYMMGPDPANYPIISRDIHGDVFIGLNGREMIMLAEVAVGDAEYIRLMNVSDRRSYVKFPTIDSISTDQHCVVLNPCTANSFDHVPWYLNMRQGDVLYLKSFPNVKAKISVYNVCAKEWAHGTGDEPLILSIPPNSWQQIDIKISRTSTEIVVAEQVHHQYKFQSLENSCDESVYIIAVAGASFSLNCETNITSAERIITDLDDTFGSGMWLWISIGAAILGLIVAMTVIVLYIIQKVKGNVNHPMHPYVRRISELRLLRQNSDYDQTHDQDSSTADPK